MDEATIIIENEWICAYCGAPASGFDHFIPVSIAHLFPNEPETIISCCWQCNRTLNNKLFICFRHRALSINPNRQLSENPDWVQLRSVIVKTPIDSQLFVKTLDDKAPYWFLKTGKTRSCRVCGRVIHLTNRTHRRKHYCSTECITAATKKRARKRKTLAKINYL